MSKAYTSNENLKIEGLSTRILSAITEHNQHVSIALADTSNTLLFSEQIIANNAKIKNDQYSTSIALIDKELGATSKRCSTNDFVLTSNNAPMIKAKKELDNISRRSVSNDFIPTRSNEAHFPYKTEQNYTSRKFSLTERTPASNIEVADTSSK